VHKAATEDMGLIWLNAGYDKSSLRDVMDNSNG
jgi:hypothetical protein